MHGRTIDHGHMHWFMENGKPFIFTREDRARVIPKARLKRPRQQHTSHSGSASTGRRSTSTTSSLGTTSPPSEGPSTKTMTPIPQAFTHSSASVFHAMGPLLKGFFTDLFGPYTLMMS
ncbi:hypothetical protein V6N13_125310 [Hibiscus sabdariffa]